MYEIVISFYRKDGTYVEAANLCMCFSLEMAKILKSIIQEWHNDRGIKTRVGFKKII